MTNGFKGNDEFDLSKEEDWQKFIDTLDTSQLKSLNSLICGRMDYLQNIDTLEKMAAFRIDEYVKFTDKKGKIQTGRISKINRKTISILSSEGKKWNVSAQLLEHVANPTVLESTHPTNRTGNFRTCDWIAGCTPLPGSVNSEKGYYVPDTLIWIDGDGMIKHLAVLEHHNEPEGFVQSFETAIHGIEGEHRQPPETLRTDNTNLIRLLSPLYPDTKFILADVPEIAEVAEHLARTITNDFPLAHTYQDLDINPLSVAAFFEATALLYKTQPWQKIPDEERLLRITIDEFGISENVVVVIGQAGLSYGVLLFDCLCDYERYTIIVNSDDTKRLEELPNHRVLNYISITELGSEQRKEIMDNGWNIVNHDAYPDLFLPVDGRVARFPDTRDLCTFEAISYALIGLFENHKELVNCWQTGTPLHLIQQITTVDGNVDVVVKLPVLPDGKTQKTLNALDEMALIDRSDFLNAKERHHDLMKEIEDTYRQSPEFKSTDEGGAGFTLLMESAFNFIEITVATLLPKDLKEILFEIVPRKIMIDATEADAIIDDCAAFFRFLKREYAMQTADEHLAILDQKAKQILRDALNDTSKFGLGKSIFAGSDMSFEGTGGGNLPANDSEFLFPHGPNLKDTPRVNAPKAFSVEEIKNRKKSRKAVRKGRKKGK